MIDIALWEPEIPPNTGNVARLCAATGAALHLVGRVGFRLDERSLRRAGVDCWPAVRVRRHVSLEDFEAAMAGRRLWYFSVRGRQAYTAVEYREGDCLVFGSESRGLPAAVLERNEGRTLQIPMPTAQVRSLNLATGVGIALYEGLRQLHRW